MQEPEICRTLTDRPAPVAGGCGILDQEVRAKFRGRISGHEKFQDLRSRIAAPRQASKKIPVKYAIPALGVTRSQLGRAKKLDHKNKFRHKA